jgi:hypothetical protein
VYGLSFGLALFVSSGEGSHRSNDGGSRNPELAKVSLRLEAITRRI